MSSIQKSTEELIESVKSGAEYRRYRKCEKALKKYPGTLGKTGQTKRRHISTLRRIKQRRASGEYGRVAENVSGDAQDTGSERVS